MRIDPVSTEHTASGRAKRRPRLIVIALVGGVALLFGLIGLGAGIVVALVREGIINPSWTDANIADSRTRAATIIAALDEYHTAHGVYPERLGDLSPDYLAQVPEPVAGVPEWTYGATDAGHEFVLQFSANQHDNPTSWYESRHEGWFIQERETVAAD